MATKPGVPEIQSVSVVSATALAIAWRDNSANEAGFELQRKRGGGSWSTIAILATDTTVYTDAGLATGSTYTYRVRAKNPAGAGEWSAEMSGKPVAPPPPSGVVTFSADERTVTISSGAQPRTFRRPVLVPWSFTPTAAVRWVAPGESISHACEVAEPGDIIFLRAGNYIENLLLTRSGLRGKPIILSCAPDALGKVKITPSAAFVRENPGESVISLRGAQYVWINGLVIEGPRGRPEAPASGQTGIGPCGIAWQNGAGLDCFATNCVVYHHVHCGLKEMGHGGTGILMAGNVVFENGAGDMDHGIYCPADQVTMDGNLVFDNVGYGIHCYSAPVQDLLTRNVCVGNGAAGIILAGTEARVFHNVCTGNGQGIQYYAEGCRRNMVKNNIFAGNGTDCSFAAYSGRPGPTENVDDFNCYWPGKPAAQLGSQVGGHEVLADPRFVDPAAGDFRLQAGSPCVGRATDVGLGKDMGAY